LSSSSYCILIRKGIKKKKKKGRMFRHLVLLSIVCFLSLVSWTLFTTLGSAKAKCLLKEEPKANEKNRFVWFTSITQGQYLQLENFVGSFHMNVLPLEPLARLLVDSDKSVDKRELSRIAAWKNVELIQHETDLNDTFGRFVIYVDPSVEIRRRSSVDLNNLECHLEKSDTFKWVSTSKVWLKGVRMSSLDKMPPKHCNSLSIDDGSTWDPWIRVRTPLPGAHPYNPFVRKKHKFFIVFNFDNGQFDTMLRSLWLWKRIPPCTLSTEEVRPTLVFFTTYALSKEQQKMIENVFDSSTETSSQKISECFESILFHGSGLSGQQVDYDHGPNNMFIAVVYKDPWFDSLRRRHDYFFWMEPDLLVVRSDWISKLLDECSDIFWGKGGTYQGDHADQDGKNPFWMRININGNGLWSTRREFALFQQRIYQARIWQGGFDTSIFIYFWHRSNEIRAHWHKFHFSRMVLNFGGVQFSPSEILDFFPETFFVHGKHRSLDSLYPTTPGSEKEGGLYWTRPWGPHSACQAHAIESKCLQYYCFWMVIDVHNSLTNKTKRFGRCVDCDEFGPPKPNHFHEALATKGRTCQEYDELSGGAVPVFYVDARSKICSGGSSTPFC
jgi:hypothetical protein